MPLIIAYPINVSNTPVWDAFSKSSGGDADDWSCRDIPGGNSSPVDYDDDDGDNYFYNFFSYCSSTNLVLVTAVFDARYLKCQFYLCIVFSQICVSILTTVSLLTMLEVMST